MQVAPTASTVLTDHDAALARGDGAECERLELRLVGRMRGQPRASLERIVHHACRAARLLRLEGDPAGARGELQAARELLAEHDTVRRTELHEHVDALWIDVLVSCGDWAAAAAGLEERLARAQAERDWGRRRWEAQLLLARCARERGDASAALAGATAAAQGLASHCSAEVELVDEALALVQELHEAAGDAGAAAAVRAERDQRAAELAAHVQATRSEELGRILIELDALVGLHDLKAAVRTLANFLRVQVLREAEGRPRAELVQHLVFSGPPGTGKTTVARLMGKILRAVGLLEVGHVVEVGRADLVAGFAGQTAIKTSEVIESALDGILFIDEAYALFDGPHGANYGPEAVATLIRAMEDHRDRLVVIIAGYPDPLETLLRSNPGLSSRFTTTMTFTPYDAGELGEIFCRMAAADQYVVEDEAREQVVRLCAAMLERADEHFGNARAVRNVYKDTLTQHADRVVALGALSGPALSTLTAEDLVWEDRPDGALRGEFERRRRFPAPGGTG
jgi:hypothetical protein